MLRRLDGPSKQGNASVTSTTPFEVKVGASAAAREVVTIQADQPIYVYFADEGETPNAAAVAASGFTQTRNIINTYEASTRQAIWVLAISLTASVRFAERG